MKHSGRSSTETHETINMIKILWIIYSPMAVFGHVIFHFVRRPVHTGDPSAHLIYKYMRATSVFVFRVVSGARKKLR